MTYMLNRLLSVILTLFLITLVTFGVTNILPGLSRVRRNGGSLSAHGSQDGCRSTRFFHRLAPRRRLNSRPLRVLSVDRVGCFLEVLRHVERIDKIHRVAREVRRQRIRHRAKARPLRRRTVAGEDDVHVWPLRDDRHQLVREVLHKSRLERFRHSPVVDGVQAIPLVVEERHGSHGCLVPRATLGAVAARGRLDKRRPVPQLVPWWVRFLGFAPARLRVLTVLRHHHAVQRDLNGDRSARNGLLRTQRRLDDRTALLVPCRHRARNPTDARLADGRRADLDQQLRRFLVRHHGRCARYDTCHARCIRSLDDTETQVHRDGDASPTRLLIDAALDSDPPEQREVLAGRDAASAPCRAVDLDLWCIGVRLLHRRHHQLAAHRAEVLLNRTLDIQKVQGLPRATLKVRLELMPLALGNRLASLRHESGSRSPTS